MSLKVIRLKDGSGSFEKDGPLSIVAMEKKEQTRLVHHYRLGKRQRHANKTSQALTERIVPALHVGGFTRLFAYGCVLLLRKHRLVCCPEVREAMSLAVGEGNALPQTLARLFAPITQRIRDHLSRLATQGNPYPDLIGFFEHKRP